MQEYRLQIQREVIEIDVIMNNIQKDVVRLECLDLDADLEIIRPAYVHHYSLI